MADVRMWTSKLGNKFPFDTIQASDAASQKELKRLRSLPENSSCAECGAKDNSWASVTHGVFVCIVCSDVHRAVGTHITKMKGCTGTYLWGPDELEAMQSMGNRKAAMKYGNKVISSHASKEEKQRHVVDKYDRKLFANKTAPQAPEPAPKPVDESLARAKVPPCNQGQRPIATPLAVSIAAQVQEPKKMTTACTVPDSFFDDLFGDLDCDVPAKAITSAESQPPLIDLLA